MRYLILAALLVALPAYAAESKHDKDVRECRKAPPVMQHPAELKKAKRDAFNVCMRGKGRATAPIK